MKQPSSQRPVKSPSLPGAICLTLSMPTNRVVAKQWHGPLCNQHVVLEFSMPLYNTHLGIKCHDGYKLRNKLLDISDLKSAPSHYAKVVNSKLQPLSIETCMSPNGSSRPLPGRPKGTPMDKNEASKEVN